MPLTSIGYTTNLPVATNSPSQDVTNMTNNTNSLNAILGTRDIIGFNVANSGCHQSMNLQETNTAGTPTLPGSAPGVPGVIAGAGFGTLYASTNSAQIGGNAGEIFFTRGGATQIQMTGPGTPTAATNGSTFLPGGILLQWGFDNAIVAQSTLITFPITYNNLFIVIAQPFANNVANFLGVGYGTDGGSAANFNYKVTNPASLSKMVWWAIGN